MSKITIQSDGLVLIPRVDARNKLSNIYGYNLQTKALGENLVKDENGATWFCWNIFETEKRLYELMTDILYILEEEIEKHRKYRYFSAYDFGIYLDKNKVVKRNLWIGYWQKKPGVSHVNSYRVESNYLKIIDSYKQYRKERLEEDDGANLKLAEKYLALEKTRVLLDKLRKTREVKYGTKSTNTTNN